MAEERTPRWRYLGEGRAWVAGAPARDLTADEWERLPEAVRARCVSTGLYVLETPREEDNDGR